MIHYIIMELKLTIISNHYFLSVNDWFDYSGALHKVPLQDIASD